MAMLPSSISILLTGVLLLGLPVVNVTAAEDKVTTIPTSKKDGKHIFDTGLKVTGISTIPATGHRGAAKLVVAHADKGVKLYNFDGTVLWQDDTPASLVSFYQGNLIVFRDHEDTTRLDTYSVSTQGDVNFLNTATPSPIAATTIQRTAFALVGPVRLDGNTVTIEASELEIELDEPVSAFAASKRFIPLFGSDVHIVALESGKIIFSKAE